MQAVCIWERRLKKSLFMAWVCCAALSSAWAWPDKPITVVVTFPAGGSTDSIARAMLPQMQAKLGASMVIDNRSGATGTIAAASVKRAAPDGHTLMVTSLGPLVIAPHLIKGVSYDALKDFDPITIAVQAPNVLVVPANSPFKSLTDVIGQLKKTPDKVTFASSGNGSSDHLTAELFWQQTGTSGLHIPYKGGAPAINDLLGAQVDASFQNINAVLQHILAGKLRALAVTSAKRSPVLPQVASLTELGLPLEVTSWQAMVAPRGLPADIKSRIHEAAVQALQSPAVKDKLVAQGFEVVANSPEQFAQFQAAEFARWKKVIELGKITAD
jgi:tripartite-type tricarboxylate transporter receptor subunit TctC